VVGKHSGSSIYDCAPQLCRRHRAKLCQWKRDLASRRLRAYESDGLDGSILWPWAYTYTHADSYLHATYTHSDSYLHAPYTHADSDSYLHAQTDTHREARALDETAADSTAETLIPSDQ
jgi:hypothetical protein